MNGAALLQHDGLVNHDGKDKAAPIATLSADEFPGASPVAADSLALLFRQQQR